MMKIRKSLLIVAGVFILSSCSEDNKEAKEYMQNIRKLYERKEYSTAKQKIDSIRVLFPKAFDQQKEALALLQDLRRGQDNDQIAFCDSAVNTLQSKVDSLKRYFVYDRNKEYEETGRYLPKATSSPILTGTLLRSGVNENGQLYIESVYLGGQYHNTVKISTKDGLFAETLAVTDDGINFRFTDSGKQYEVIKFSGADENGVAKFIYSYANKPLTVTLKGKGTTSYALSAVAKSSISSSYQLSLLMTEIDSLKDVREISIAHIKYLDQRKGTPKQTE